MKKRVPPLALLLLVGLWGTAAADPPRVLEGPAIKGIVCLKMDENTTNVDWFTAAKFDRKGKMVGGNFSVPFDKCGEKSS